MTLDVALIWNPQLGEADFAIYGGDLATDAGLQTAVIVSLFTDRLADPGDEIPDGTADRRGWWGDMPVDATAQDTPAAGVQLIGSRLWLLTRALQTQDTLNRAKAYAEESLAWMVADGVAGRVTATASFPRLGWLQLDIDIVQAGSSVRFSLPWGATAEPVVPPAQPGTEGDMLADSDGLLLVDSSGNIVVGT